MIRFTPLAVAMLAATSAHAADVTELPRWSADAHQTEGRIAKSAVAAFEAEGRGWRVTLDCETTDTGTGAVTARERHEGVAVRTSGAIMMVLDGGRARATLALASGEQASFMSGFPGCPIGPANLGTGD